MNGKLNKILPIAGLFCGSLVFSSVFADTDTTSDNQTSKSQMQEITPPAGFAAEQGIGFSVYGDFIYWEAIESNLGFARTYNDGYSVDEVFFPSFKYKPGFRTGIAFDLGHDNWDLDINYTWLNASASKNKIYNEDSLKPLYTTYGYGSAEYLDQAYSSWYLHYNLIRADLGRDFYISQYLTLRPYFGLSGAWNNQKQSVTYYDYEDPYYYETDLTLKQNYWGVGFNTGLQTNWYFDENWSVYGNLGFMNLWSKYTVQSKEIDSSNDFGLFTGIAANTQSIQYGLQNVLDLEAGVRWGMTFDDDTMGFSIQAGWEQQVWINHAQFTNEESNLSLQGLTTRIRLDF